MIANKDIEMPNGCISVTTRPFYSDELVYDYCPFYNTCDHAEFSEVNVRPNDCPLVEIVSCKECKHWKDSDGVYRRGPGAESKCPMNIKEVFEGNFYCAHAERTINGSD